MTRTFFVLSVLTSAALLAIAVFAAAPAQAKGLRTKLVKEDETFRYYYLEASKGKEVGWKVENKTSKPIHVNEIVVRYQCNQGESVRKQHLIVRSLRPGKRGGTGLSSPCGAGGKVTSAEVEGVVFNEVGIPYGSNKARCDDGSKRSFIVEALQGSDNHLRIVVPGRNIKIILRNDGSKATSRTLADAICGANQSLSALNWLKTRLRKYFKSKAAEHEKACAANPKSPDCEKAKEYERHAACMCIRG